MCGPERVLVEEVVDFIRGTLKLGDTEYAQLSALDTADRDIWGSLNQYPFQQGAVRLVLIRDAEAIKRWDPFLDWIAQRRLMPTTHVLFVSNEADFDEERPVHRAIVDMSGHMIRCNHLDEDQSVAWLQAQCSIHTGVAEYLLERVGGDLWKAKQCLWKIGLLTGDPNKEIIDVLAVESVADAFTDALVAGNRRRAITALEELPENDYSKAIGLLDSRIEALEKIHRAIKRGQGPREMSINRVMSPFLVRLLYPFAKSYDAPTVERRRQLLTLVDGYVREGARVGTMEGLCALW